MSATAISTEDSKQLTSLDAISTPAKLGTSGTIDFYRFATSDHGDCYAVGTGPIVLGAVMCDQTFPTSQRPVLDASIVVKNDLSSAGKIVDFMGFAADNVAHVSIVDPAGHTASADVVNNTYFLPASRITLDSNGSMKLIAYDSNGTDIYEQPFG